MKPVALATAAAAVAWIGVVLHELCIKEATLWTWQEGLFEEQGVKQDAAGTWVYNLAGLEVPQHSVQKYLGFT